MKFSTRTIHVGQDADPAYGAVVPPLYQSSTYRHEEIGKHKGYEYSRTGNPTRTALETCLASLEEGEHALAFASGLAATVAILSVLRSGDHVVAARDLYGGTIRLFDTVYGPRYGIGVTYVDGRDPAAFRKALRKKTRLIWIETPANPLLQLTDIAAVAEIARHARTPVAVDNTFATPCFQKPLVLGADLVVHSTTKYISGHSDVIGGAVVMRDRDLYEAIKFYQNAAGGVPGPFDVWLTLRGVKTLALRMKAHQENAFRVAEFLAGHVAVEAVHYPGLPAHPQHELARRQMTGFGGMVTFLLRGGLPEANHFVKNLRLFTFAESLGGVKSLACHPATMSHASIPEEERLRRGITAGTIRLSVGIEDADDLIEDLARALGAVRSLTDPEGARPPDDSPPDDGRLFFAWGL